MRANATIRNLRRWIVWSSSNNDKLENPSQSPPPQRGSQKDTYDFPLSRKLHKAKLTPEEKIPLSFCQKESLALRPQVFPSFTQIL
jgi:hypothetical protein